MSMSEGPVERMTVTLTSRLAETVRGAVASGDYASYSEVIREAMRDWRHRREIRGRMQAELRADVEVGLADVEAGRVRDFDAERILENGEKRLAGTPSE